MPKILLRGVEDEGKVILNRGLMTFAAFTCSPNLKVIVLIENNKK